MIPPPSKSRFMAIHTAESWENPSITVQPGMLELRVTLADPNPSLGSGGMLRPVAARQQELNISLDKLDEAVSAIPQSAWPYGRVISVEEPTNTPAKAEPQVDAISRWRYVSSTISASLYTMCTTELWLARFTTLINSSIYSSLSERSASTSPR